MLYITLLGRRFLDPPEMFKFMDWLDDSPLTAGDRVSLKKEWEYLTGVQIPKMWFNRIRGYFQRGTK